jgi:hypothetical protein
MTVENKHTIYIDRCIEIINKTVSIKFSSTCASRLDTLSLPYYMIVLTVLTRVGVLTKHFFFHLWKMQKRFIAKSDLFFRFLKKVLIPCFRFKIDYILGFPC